VSVRTIVGPSREEQPSAPFKRFIIFSITDYYPSGGLDDIWGDADFLEEARAMRQSRSEYSYIVDRDTWKKVA